MKASLVLERIEAGIQEGSAFIAQEVAANVVKYGISPVIAIGGKIKNLRPKILELSEIENVEKILKKHGFKCDDFYLMEDKKNKYRDDKTILTSGCIVCVSKKTGKVKEYPANHGSSWIDDFNRDLKNKCFDN
jgi:hypothetical protein